MKAPDDLGQLNSGEYSLVDDLADQLEQAWRNASGSTSGIDLTPLLPPAGHPLRASALQELIKTDLSCRWQRGLTSSLEEYVQKFPELGSLDKLPASLIYEEFRVRQMHGVNTPIDAYRSRFPGQFNDFEKLVSDSFVTQVGAKTAPLSKPTASASASAASMNSGYVVGGHYTLLKRIGAGGFGEVWRATDTHGGIDKAVKILSRPLDSEEAKTELKALEIIKTLNHPYLLRTEGFFVEQDRLIIVMELADKSLRDLLKAAKDAKNSAVSPKDLLTYMRHSAEALDYLHAQGIVHRDIKPENILLVGKIAKLADFGLARAMSNRRSTMTNFAGTGAYSPPETWKGKLTTFSDQYALAVTYGELRLGKMVYKARTIFEFMTAHLTEKPVLDPLPIEEQEVLFRALAKEPKARFGTCMEFVEELLRVAQGEHAPRRSTSPPPPKLIDAGMLDDESSLRATRKGASDSLLGDDSLGTVRASSTHSSTPRQTPSSPKTTEPNLARKPTVAMPKAGPTAAIPKASSTRTYPSRSSKQAKRGKGGLVAALVVVLLLSSGAAAMFLAKSKLETNVQEQLDKHDYAAAFSAIKDAGALVAPFRSSILDQTRLRTLDDAKRFDREGDLTALEKPLQALLAQSPEDPTALELLDKCLAPTVKDLITKGQYDEAYLYWSKLPAGLASKSLVGQSLQKNWLDEAKGALKLGNYAKAQDVALAFLNRYPGNAEATGVQQQASVPVKARELLQDKKFAEARKAVPTNFPDGGKLEKEISGELATYFAKQLKESPDAAFTTFQGNVAEFPVVLKPLVEPVKLDWAKKQEAAFLDKSADETKKEAALANVTALLQSFPKDKQIEPIHDKLRAELFAYLKDQGEQAKQQKRYGEAVRLWTKATDYGSPEELQSKIKIADVMSRLQEPLTGGTIAAVRQRLKEIFDSKSGEGQGDLAKVCLDLSKSNPEFKRAIADLNLDRFSSTALFDEAKKSLEKNEAAQAVAHLDSIDLARIDSKEDKDQLAKLYAEVGEKYPLSRKGLTAIAKLKESDQGRYQKILTRFIEKNALQWPTKSDDTWAVRLQESADADPANPVVQAYKSEADLELKQADKIKPFVVAGASSNVLRSYVAFVQARVDLAQGAPLQAAKRIESATDKDPWLNGKRTEQLAEIYHAAAASMKKGGVFPLVKDADQAYDWMTQAEQWMKKAEGAKALTAKTWPEALQTYALAAASKSSPDFDLAKKLTDELLPLANPKDAEFTTLLLMQAQKYGKELRERIKSKTLMLPTLEKQIAANDKIAASPSGELRKRQAWLWALAGDAHRQTAERSQSLEAYKEAIKLAPKEREIVLVYASIGANSSVTDSRLARAREDRIKILREALSLTDPVKAEAMQDALWAEAALFRSMICLELGNHLNFAQLVSPEKESKEKEKKKKEWQDLIAEALEFAKKVKEAGTHPRPGEVELALGNSHEDMARFVESEPEKNFPLSMDAFGEAKKHKSEKEKGTIGRGRAAYRWALFGGDRDKLLKEAQKELKSAADQPDSPEAPEAQFWLGKVYMEQRDYPNAFTSLMDALDTSLRHKAPDWTVEAGNQLSKVVFLQSDPKIAADWTKKFFTGAKKVKKVDPVLASHWISSVANQRALQFILKKDGAAAASAFEEGLTEVPTDPKPGNIATGHVALLANLGVFRMSGAAAKLIPAWGMQEFLDVCNRIEQATQSLESNSNPRKDDPETRRVRAEAWFTAASIQSKFGTLDKEDQYWARATAAKHPTKMSEIDYHRIGFLLQKAKMKDEKELVRLAEEALEHLDDDKEMPFQTRTRYVAELQQVIDQFKKK